MRNTYIFPHIHTHTHKIVWPQKTYQNEIYAESKIGKSTLTFYIFLIVFLNNIIKLQTMRHRLLLHYIKWNFTTYTGLCKFWMCYNFFLLSSMGTHILRIFTIKILVKVNNMSRVCLSDSFLFYLIFFFHIGILGIIGGERYNDECKILSKNRLKRMSFFHSVCSKVCIYI